jgi:hypothetical protein
MNGWKKAVTRWRGVRKLKARRDAKRLARKQERQQGKSTVDSCKKDAII